MRNIMYFAGSNSREIPCVVIKLPAIPRAMERGDWTDLAGIDGSSFVSENVMAAVDMPVPLWIPPETDLAALFDWLRGAGNLRFNNWPWFWKARITAAFVLTPCDHDDGWNTTVTFKVQPHRYLWPEAAAMEIGIPGVIENPGTADSKPLIELTAAAAGEINLMIGSYTMAIRDMAAGQKIVIDCADGVKRAWDGSTGDSLTGKISTGGGFTAEDKYTGRWPALEPGVNAINATGSVSSLKITPRWRYR